MPSLSRIARTLIRLGSPLRRPPSAGRRSSRERGQSLVELAIVTPILLLIFAGAADLGRAFYAYVAVESAAKEGALAGLRAPLCDDAGVGCADPNNVVWHVRSELQNLRNADGSPITPTVQCLTPGPAGVPRAALKDCAEGDTYAVTVSYAFHLLTPILGTAVGDLNLTSTSRAVVLNLAFDPTPGVSVQKLVLPTGAKNASEIVAKCLEPDDFDSQGYYRSPCSDASTPADPSDVLYTTFEQGKTITYKVTIGNSGVQPLSGATVVDSTGSLPCSFGSNWAVGFSKACTYTRTAPTLTGTQTIIDYTNQVTADTAQTAPASDSATVKVERPPAEFQVLKWVSPFKDGNDGDGNPSFGTQSAVTVAFNSQVPQPAVWFKVIVTNTGGQTASAVQFVDSRGALPYGQSNASAVCDAKPTTMAAGAIFQCRYKATFNTAGVVTNTVTATSSNVTPDGNDAATATVTVTTCTGSNRVVPSLIGLNKAGASAAWTAAGFSGSLTTWNGNPNAQVVAQSRPAYGCVAQSSTMTASKDVTP